MFWMKNKENSFPIHTLIWRPVLYSQDAEANAVKSDHDSPNHTLESVKADTSSRPSSGKNSKTGSLDRDRKKSKNASLGKYSIVLDISIA